MRDLYCSRDVVRLDLDLGLSIALPGPPISFATAMIVAVPLHIVDHPLVQDALIELRDVRTAPPQFRRAANRISVLLAAEALRDVPSMPSTVETPLGPADGHGRRAETSWSCRCCEPGSECSTRFSSCCRPRASATSACSATRRPPSRRSTTRSCRRTSPTATS